ncbi:QRFP-like peptide receptor [Montipora capricornis]|uniref:QRFP-like peptide receptor n=1 Tax=Montipora capricornis TaxID=246305 RepID=UPI0035F2156C
MLRKQLQNSVAVFGSAVPGTNKVIYRSCRFECIFRFFVEMEMTNDSDLQNRTLNFDFFSSSECIAWLTIFGIEAVAIVTLNALTIIIFLKEKSLRGKRGVYLVISLAVADMLVGCSLINLIFNLGNYCNFWTINVFETYVGLQALIIYFPAVSVTNLAVISLERMHATFRPFKHRLLKRMVFGAAVAAVWFTVGVLTASVFSQLLFRISKFLQVAAFLSFEFCCILIILVSYTSIVAKFYSTTHCQRHGAISRERKLTKTLLIVTVVSLILLLPYLTNAFYVLSSSESSFETTVYQIGWHLYVMYCVSCFFYANSFINPLLYALKIPEFKRALLLFLRCRSPRSKAVQIFPLNDI